MARIVQYFPQVDVQAWTPTGQYYHQDLMADLVQIQTHKDLVSPAGTFTLTFTSRQTPWSWASKLPPRTYVEIRAGVQQRGQPPILMRGFVDTATQVMQMPPVSGGPQRRVQVTGRDLGAVCQDFQVLYLWPLQGIANLLAAATPGFPALEENFGLTPTGNSQVVVAVADVARQVLDKLLNVSLRGIQRQFGAKAPVPLLQPWIYVAPQHRMNFLNVQPFTGAFWNLIEYLASPPLGEVFIYDADDTPYFVFRRTPYKNWQGQYPLVDPTEQQGFFPDISLGTGDALAAGEQAGHQLTVSGTDVYTYYYTLPDMADQFRQSALLYFYSPVAPQTAVDNPSGAASGAVPPAADFEVVGANPYYDARRGALYGIRQLQVATPWLPIASPDDPTAVLQRQHAAQLNGWLVQVFQHNDRYVGGTLQVHGHEKYRVGRYLVVQPWKMEFYLEAVDHFIDISSNQAQWQTTLTLTRGRPLASG